MFAYSCNMQKTWKVVTLALKNKENIELTENKQNFLDSSKTCDQRTIPSPPNTKSGETVKTENLCA